MHGSDGLRVGAGGGGEEGRWALLVAVERVAVLAALVDRGEVLLGFSALAIADGGVELVGIS